MAGEPDETNEPDDPRRRDQNPFAGTPMEDMLKAFGGGQMPDMNVLMGQMQRMFAPHEGHVNWDMAKDVARHTVAASPDPSPTTAQTGAVADAARLAETWLDRATDLPVGATSSAAWSRADWVEQTTGTWRGMVEPIAEHVVGAMGQAIPEEAKAMVGPLLGMLTQAGGAMFGQQVGQALGGLAAEVHSSTDVGLPLGPTGVAAVLPANVKAFGEGLEVSDADLLLYVVIRECAHHRLFAHAPWLRGRLTGAIEEFGRGTTIDVSAIEQRLGTIDPSNPAAIQEAMQEGLFEPQRTPAQQAALDRLEALLAFVEGWVDDVVDQATAETMPAAAKLREAMRRRRATGGPAEQTFASLVGLELRPRRLRDAATLWAALRDRQGAAARDAVWAHPDLMPTAADLDDPLGFAQGERAAADDAGDSVSDDDFDTALTQLLERGEAEAAQESDGADDADGSDADSSDAGPSDAGSSDVDPSDGEDPPAR